MDNLQESGLSLALSGPVWKRAHLVLVLGLSVGPSAFAAKEIRCLIGFKALADSAEFAERTFKHNRQRVEIPAAEQSRKLFLSQNNPNAVWDSHQSPLGIYYPPAQKGARDTGGFVHAEDIAAFNRDLQKRLKNPSRETTEAGRQGELLSHVLQAEARAAHELEQQLKKASREGAASNQIQILEERLSSVLEDILSKGLELTSMHSLDSLPLKYRRQFGVIARDALQRFLELHKIPYEMVEYERATPQSPAKHMIRFLPDTLTPTGRLAKALDKNGSMLVTSPLNWYEEDRHAVRLGQSPDGRFYYHIVSEVLDTALPESARDRIVRTASQTVKTRQTRSPLEVTLFRVSDGPNGRSTMHGSTSGFTAGNSHELLRQMADIMPDYETALGMLKTPGAIVGAIDEQIKGARDFDEASTAVDRVMDHLLVGLSIPGGHQAKLIHREEFPAVVISNSSGKYLGEIRAVKKRDGVTQLVLRTDNRLIAFPAKGTELEEVGVALLQRMIQEARGKKEVDPSPMLQDLVQHTLAGLKRNIQNSHYLLKPGTELVAEAYRKTFEFSKNPNAETYGAVVAALRQIPNFNAIRSTNRGVNDKNASETKATPLNPQEFVKGKVSPFLMQKLQNSEGTDRRTLIGQVGVDAISRWAYSNNFAVADRSLDNVGYDLEFVDRFTGKHYHVEVKARSAGADDSIVSLNANEVAFAQQNPETSLLGYVRVHPDGTTELSLSSLNLSGASNPAISSISLDVNRLPSVLKKLAFQ